MKHILLVEDDPMNAAVIRAVLGKRTSYRVTVTEDAAEVFDRAQSGELYLVIMDVSLTNTHWQGKPVSGVDLCRLLKSDPRTAGLPVLLATAHAMRGDSEQLLAASGADDYVAKPILDHAHFVDQVRGWVERAA